MNEVQRRMGKLRGWNLALLILASISLIVNVVSLPGTLFPKKITSEFVTEKNAQAIYEAANAPSYKIVAIIHVLLAIVLVALLFVAFRKLKEEQLPSKLPYFLNLGYWVFDLLLGLVLSGLTVENIQSLSNVGGMDAQVAPLIGSVVLVSAIIGIAGSIILQLPAIMCLVHIFKIEGLQEEE